MIKALSQFDSTIFAWIGEIILQTNAPIVVSEIYFRDRLKDGRQAPDSDNDDRDFTGKIDDVLVHPTRDPLDWCALEVHFSGKAMEQGFKSFGAEKHQALPSPEGERHPDWRSSGRNAFCTDSKPRCRRFERGGGKWRS